MSESLANSGVPTLDTRPNPLLDTLARGMASPQLGAVLALASALTLGVGLIMWSVRPEYVPIAEQISRTDAVEIVQSLDSKGIKYRFDPNTGLILVPQDKLSQVQLELAASGLAPSGSVGLELLHEEPSLGMSHFTETARYQHGLETELSRTIGSMRNIESARVHLALPRQSVFVRDREQASASIMVKPSAGRVVENEQVQAIVNLVASSIPYLDSSQVTVVDQWGRLLSTGDSLASGVSREQYDYARKLEKLYADRVETLLLPMVGPGRVRAIVTADVDFSVNERTEEAFEPDSAQLRSEQTENQISDSNGAIGIPGALTNQPPVDGTIEPPAEAAEGTPVPDVVNQSSSEIRNYELDKIITHTRQSPGAVRRLSAAVVVDDVVSIDESGNTVRTPVPAETLEEYASLVREAIGFDEARGDSVVVFNRAFQPVAEIEPVEPLPLWQQDWVWNGVRQSLIGLAVLLLVLLVLRPAAKKLSPASRALPQKGSDDASEEKGGSASKNSALESPPVVYGDILNMARAMAAEDPKRVAIVVKDWVRES